MNQIYVLIIYCSLRGNEVLPKDQVFGGHKDDIKSILNILL